VDDFDDLNIFANANGWAVVEWAGGQVTLKGATAASLSSDDCSFG
jgi:hypothetical protein